MFHFGLDTLSWARSDADVTGVDFSGEAVGAARQSADEVGLPAQFVQAEFHPQQTMVDEDLRVRTSYFREGAADRNVNALAGGGLRVERLDELPVELRRRSPEMIQDTDGFWRLPGDPLPLLLTCRAVKD